MPISSSLTHLSSQINTRSKTNAISISSSSSCFDTQSSQAPATSLETLKNMRPQEDPKKASNGSLGMKDRGIRYRECRKNHAASIGGYAVDGCREFMPSGEGGTSGSLKCAACNCHRNFHKKEIDLDSLCDRTSNSSTRK